ncbi:MAG: hypothetical protein LC659_09665 [Myxococcales bacterium]|nr:hypothetical protein [Myxococcales bacterium]
MRAFAFALSLALVAGCNDNTDKQNLAVGSPCTTSGQCGTGKYFCDLRHPNGYCKAVCHKDSDCPTGSVCAGAGLISAGECHKACPNGAADCRSAEGYVCKVAMPADASAQYCDLPEAAGDGGA